MPIGMGILTEEEASRDYITWERLIELIDREDAVVSSLSRDRNSYGEFTFVKLTFMPVPRGEIYGPNCARPLDPEWRTIGFYGLGYHEHRDVWYTERWHISTMSHMRFDEVQVNWLRKEPTIEKLYAELERIEPLAKGHKPDRRGQVFAMLADLTDDDAAISDMEDGVLDFLLDE